MPQYRRYINVQLPVALNDTSGIINAALEGLYAIYKNGYEYKKCGVVLNDLVQANEVQQSLFCGFHLDLEVLAITCAESTIGLFLPAQQLVG